MTSFYEELERDLSKLISSYRKEIIIEDENSNLVRRKDFYYNGQEYLLVSVLPNYPYVQLLALYGQGKKIERAYIVIGNHYFHVNKKIAIKEINSIRKYNGYQLSNKCINIPNYESSFPKEILIEIKELFKFVTSNGERLLKNASNDKLFDYNVFCSYVNHCKVVDSKREKNRETRKLVKIC